MGSRSIIDSGKAYHIFGRQRVIDAGLGGVPICNGNRREGFVGIIGRVGRREVGHVLKAVAIGVLALIAVIAIEIDPVLLIGDGSSGVIVIPGTGSYRCGT